MEIIERTRLCDGKMCVSHRNSQGVCVPTLKKGKPCSSHRHEAGSRGWVRRSVGLWAPGSSAPRGKWHLLHVRVPPGSPDKRSLSLPSWVLTVQPSHMWVLSAEAILAASLTAVLALLSRRVPTVRTDLHVTFHELRTLCPANSVSSSVQTYK